MPYLIYLLLLLFVACGTNIEQTAYENLNVEQFRAKLNDPGVVILDVRTPEETAAGKIPNAVEINIQAADFEQQLNRLDKSKTYLVYCKAGGRSARACSTMEDIGFKK